MLSVLPSRPPRTLVLNDFMRKVPLRLLVDTLDGPLLGSVELSPLPNTFLKRGISVALQTPAGLATQTIAPGSGQIAQLLQIAGNNQQVANALQLHLQTQQMSAAMLRQLGVLQALQNRR